ncbi:MAG: helix-turn-helix transcriptional regulator, partial [Prevotellaceae bacterium]|nr:helix-turn-helix transcriptional regulator [Prevotellaceae bacterium]
GFLADKMCMSHSTLYRKIKGLTEVSVNEFIRKTKMRKGAGLLREGRHSVTEIAYMTGFNSVTYFRQCFKEEYGMTPSEYVKKRE